MRGLGDYFPTRAVARQCVGAPLRVEGNRRGRLSKQGDLSRRCLHCTLLFALFAATGLIALAGCSGGGPPRFHASGNVTYGGQPVPAGSVTFVPDTSKGNSGPAVSAEIKNGKYNTRGSGTGHVGGPHVVKITGLSGIASDEFSAGEPIFPSYEIRIDLPKKAGTHDFEVPGNWVFPPAPRGPIDPGP